MSDGISRRASRSTPTNIRGHQDALVIGLISGMLAGFLLDELGLGRWLGGVSLLLILATSAAVGAAVALAGRPRIMVVIDVALLALFFLIVATPIMSPAAAAWTRADSLPARVDAIVVLSANINSAGTLNDQSTARLLSGLELLQRGVAPRLITTEISTRVGNVTLTSTADRERLVTLAGAREAWTYVTNVRNTHDEATQVRATLGAGKSIVLVTSPLHTRRACATFERVGFKVFCVPSREQEYNAWHPRTARDRLESFCQYVYERLGMVEYRARGWLPTPP